MVAIIPVHQPDGTAEERGKAVKLAKRRCISTSDIAYFSAYATPLCLSASCYPSLSLRAIVPTERIVSHRTYGTEAVSVISTLRENRYRPDLFPDVAQCQNNTSYIKPFRTNALELFSQGCRDTSPKKMLRSYFEYNRRNGKCDVVTDITEFLPFYDCLFPRPNLIIQ